MPTRPMSRSRSALAPCLALLVLLVLAVTAEAQNPVFEFEGSIENPATTRLENGARIESGELVLGGDGAETSRMVADNVALARGSFTVRFRMRSERTHSGRSWWRAVAHKGRTTNQRTPGFWLGPDDDHLYFALSTSETHNRFGRTARTIPLNQWVDIVYVHDAEAREVRLFVDGRLEANLPYTGDAAYDDGPFHFGADPHHPSFRGRLDDIVISNRLAGFPFRWEFDGTLDSVRGPDGTDRIVARGLPWADAAAVDGRLRLASRESGIRTEDMGTLGSSTVQLTMRLWEDSTGSFRSIVHNGSSNEERTPGLWLDQNSRHLLFAASTDRNWNEWGRSNREIPQCEAVDVAYVVDASSRQVQLFIDGQLDSQRALTGAVQANDGPFYLGRSPWNYAFRGELDDVVIHDRLLSVDEIRARIPSGPEATLANITSYAVYYGSATAGALAQLAEYDMVIIQSRYYTARQIQTLKNGGTIVIGYVSAGEEEPEYRTSTQAFRDWDFPGSPENEDYDSFYVRPTAAWIRHVSGTRIQDALDLGCDGIFLDTLDTADIHNLDLPGFDDAGLGVSQDELRAEFVAMVRQLHADHSEVLFIGNRGMSLFPMIGAELDGVVFESFSQPQMLDANGQIDPNHMDTRWTDSMVADVLSPCSEIRLLSLDFVDGPTDSRVAVYRQRAIASGLLPFFSGSDRLLDDLWQQP